MAYMVAGRSPAPSNYRLAIESLDKAILGVDINIKSVALNICRGYVNISDLIVQNPEDQGFTSEYMMKIGHVCLNISLWRIITSLGKRFEIWAVILEDVDIVYEKGGWTSSNVNWVIENLTKGSEPEEAPAKA